MQHDVHVGTAVANINGALGRNFEPCFQFLDDGHLPVACRHANNRSDLSGMGVVVEFSAEDVVGCDDAFER